MRNMFLVCFTCRWVKTCFVYTVVMQAISSRLQKADQLKLIRHNLSAFYYIYRWLQIFTSIWRQIKLWIRIPYIPLCCKVNVYYKGGEVWFFRVLFLCISDLLCFTNYFVSIGHIVQFWLSIKCTYIHTYIFWYFDFNALHSIPYCKYCNKLFVGNKFTVFTVQCVSAVLSLSVITVCHFRH